MGVDVTKVQFASEFDIDKIQTWSSTVDSSPNLNQTNFNVGIPLNPNPGAGPNNYNGEIPNPYGKRGLITIAWSIDKQNWYPQGGVIQYFNNALMEYRVQMAMSGGCSDSQIVFTFSTEYTANQTVFFQFAVSNPT